MSTSSTTRRRASNAPLLLGGASPSSNDGNLLSRQPCQAVAEISVLVRRLRVDLMFDGLGRGNHRRGRAAATPSGSAYGAYRCATNGGGGWGPGHTGNVGITHASRPFASERFSPRAPAPVAPPLPAQYAIRRDNPDENAPSRLYCRSKPPPTKRPQRSAYDNRNRRRADRR